MKRLIALVLLFALALAQGLEAFWKAVEVLRNSESPVSRAMASMPPAESICFRLRLSSTAWAS